MNPQIPPARMILAAVCLSALLLAAAAPAHAHRVNIFAWVEGDTVHAEATFAGGKKPAMDSPVDVLNAASGEKYLETRTDEAGKMSFTIPQAAREAKADLKLVLHASMGHQSEWTVEAAEYLGASGDESAPQAVAAPQPDPGAAPAPALNDAALGKLVEAAVGKAVESHIAPLKRMIAEQSEAGPSLSDIVGGLGWIVGLIGMYAWARSRKGQA